MKQNPKVDRLDRILAAFFNSKTSVGKSTLSACTAHGLSHRGAPVLFSIDETHPLSRYASQWTPHELALATPEELAADELAHYERLYGIIEALSERRGDIVVDPGATVVRPLLDLLGLPSISEAIRAAGYRFVGVVVYDQQLDALVSADAIATYLERHVPGAEVIVVENRRQGIPAPSAGSIEAAALQALRARKPVVIPPATDLTRRVLDRGVWLDNALTLDDAELAALAEVKPHFGIMVRRSLVKWRNSVNTAFAERLPFRTD